LPLPPQSNATGEDARFILEIGAEGSEALRIVIKASMAVFDLEGKGSTLTAGR